MTVVEAVDYDKNPTRLYEAIHNADWTAASRALRLYPEEARTWVLRRERDEHGKLLIGDDYDEGNILWRFLPLHSALARSPPARFIHSLLKAYPDAVTKKDVNGMLPLHYACGNRASKETIQLLIQEYENLGFLNGVWEGDANGMTALHYIGSFGQCEIGIIDLILYAADQSCGEVGKHSVRDLITLRDNRGTSPLELARDGEYDGWLVVLNAMEKHLNDNSDRGDSIINRLSLNVDTIQSPRTDVDQMSPSHSRLSSRSQSWHGRTRSRSIPRESDQGIQNEKHFNHCISPRANSRQGGEREIYSRDDRNPVHYTSRSVTSYRDIDAQPRESFPMKTQPLGNLPSTPHSTTPTMSNIKTRHTNTSFDSPTVSNMKTPRSSGRSVVGGQFGFDQCPDQSTGHQLMSPRQQNHEILGSPRHLHLLSPRARQSSQLELSDQNSQLIAQIQSLTVENEQLTHRNHQQDLENSQLRSKLAEYESSVTYNAISNMQQTEHVAIKLKALLQSISQAKQSLSEIVGIAEQRENDRNRSVSTRKNVLLQLLAAEDGDVKKEHEYMWQGQTLGMSFGDEIKCLEGLEAEVVSLVDGMRMV